jgi:hypothetical protein
MDTELFEAPFNLAGELLDNSITAEGEARVRALAESEARKAQLQFQIPYDSHKRRPSEHFV